MATATPQSTNPGYYGQELPSVAVLTEWWARFTTNTSKSLADMTLQNWIRLVIIVGTYLLVRPYLLNLGAYVQRKQLEKEDRRAREEDERRGAGGWGAGGWGAGGLDANNLRGGAARGAKIDIPGVESDEEDEGGVVESVKEGGEWGRRARVRQRKIVRNAVEEQERRLRRTAEDSDEDIRDLLED